MFHCSGTIIDVFLTGTPKASLMQNWNSLNIGSYYWGYLKNYFSGFMETQFLSQEDRNIRLKTPMMTKDTLETSANRNGKQSAIEIKRIAMKLKIADHWYHEIN
jgi:hypothetical protein